MPSASLVMTIWPPWDTMGRGADPDWAWTTAASDPPDEIYAVWRTAVERSRQIVPQVIHTRALDGPASLTDGHPHTVRSMMLHMIVEYARHTGHADVLREAVDGRVGDMGPDDYMP